MRPDLGVPCCGGAVRGNTTLPECAFVARRGGVNSHFGSSHFAVGLRHAQHSNEHPVARWRPFSLSPCWPLRILMRCSCCPTRLGNLFRGYIELCVTHAFDLGCRASAKEVEDYRGGA